MPYKEVVEAQRIGALPDKHIVKTRTERNVYIPFGNQPDWNVYIPFWLFPYLSHIKKKEIFNHEKRTDYSN